MWPMRLTTVGLGCIFLATSTARADSRSDVEKLIRAHLAATIGEQGALFDTLADDYTLEDAGGSYFSLFAECEGNRTSQACTSPTTLFGDSWMFTLAYSGIKPVVHVDEAAHVATFYVTGTLAGKLDTEGASAKGKTQMRVAGFAKLEPKGWRIVAAKHSASVPDADLLEHGEVLVGNIFEPEAGARAGGRELVRSPRRPSERGRAGRERHGSRRGRDHRRRDDQAREELGQADAQAAGLHRARGGRLRVRRHDREVDREEERR